MERAILERPSAGSIASSSRAETRNATTSVLHEDYDVVYAEVKAVPAKASNDLAAKYGVGRLPAERKRGVFGDRDHAPQRGRYRPEEEKKEDEEILERLTQWKGFYGGFEALQEAYRPLSAVLPVRDRPATAQGTPTATLTPKAETLSPEELTAQKEAEKRTLEERLVAEREYWRQRREVEKTLKQEGESAPDSTKRPTPSPTLLQRLLEGDNEKSSTAAASSVASSNTETPVKAANTETVTPTKDSAVPLNKAQARLVEQARQRAREESSPSPFKDLPFLGSSKTAQQAEPEQQSSTASKGFKPDTSSEKKEDGLLESWSQWFKKRA